MNFTRRLLVRNSILTAVLQPLLAKAQAPAQFPRPVSVSSANGLRATQKAMDMMRGGADTLDAVIAGVNILEDDPEDTSVGYGGLPNEDGVVELDASVMHGPTHRAGAVAAIRNIKNPSKVAKVVLEHTSHVLLVGDGALRFAKDWGFEEMNLLTDKSRTAWRVWKASTSPNWTPGLASPDSTPKQISEVRDAELLAWARDVAAHPPTGTINCLAVNAAGDISGVTTTSGLAWKIAGRVGDSPLIGCGLFVDNAIGAAGSTGLGEECIKINGAHTVVEALRRGASPRDACLEALRRVVTNYNNNRRKLEQIDLNFYALKKNGEHGAANLWGSGGGTDRHKPHYSVNDGAGPSRLIESAYLLER